LKELQLVTNPGSNSLRIMIRYLLIPEKASCQKFGRIFLAKKLWLRFSWHLGDFWHRRPDQKVQSSIRIISFTRYFQDCTMKSREFHAKRASRIFSVHRQFDVP
jgi:hypothetical protein